MRLIKKSIVMLMVVCTLLVVNSTSVEAATLGKKCCAHASLKLISSVKATCARDGYKVYKCANAFCGYTKREVIAATGEHKYQDVIAMDKLFIFGRNENHTCITCGKIEAHIYKDKVVQEGSCEQDELTIETCVCGKTHGYKHVSKKAGHDLVEAETSTHATCTEPGMLVIICKNCDLLPQTQNEEALGHEYVEIERVEPVETSAGYVKEVCNRCNDEKVTELPATYVPSVPDVEEIECDHDYQEFATGAYTEATCLADGSKEVKCSICGDIKTEVIPALGDGIKHVYDHYLSTSERVCIYCGALDELYYEMNK